MSKYEPILCLDFDGVCHSYSSGWKGVDVILDPPVDGLASFIRSASLHFDVQIFSSRSSNSSGIDAMKAWFDKWMPLESLLLTFPSEKPPATVGIDDRVLTFSGTFPDVVSLKKFVPWNKVLNSDE